MAEFRAKIAPLFAGLLFTGMGFFGVATSLPRYNEFAVRERIEYRNRSDAGTPTPGGGSFVRYSGFDAGGTALFCMGVFAVGLGIATSPFVGAVGRQNMSLVVAAVWHVLGIGTVICYLHLAPRPCAGWPFVAVGVYEVVGLLPIALGVRRFSKRADG